MTFRYVKQSDDAQLRSLGSQTESIAQPKRIGNTVFADHSDFSTSPAQDAYDFAVSKGCTIVKFEETRNYGRLTVPDDEMTLLGVGSADTFDGAMIEDLVVSGNRCLVSGVVGVVNKNADAITDDGGYSNTYTNVGAAASGGSGSGTNGTMKTVGSTGTVINGGSRMDIILDRSTTDATINSLSRSSVTNNGDESNAVDTDSIS